MLGVWNSKTRITMGPDRSGRVFFEDGTSLPLLAEGLKDAQRSVRRDELVDIIEVEDDEGRKRVAVPLTYIIDRARQLLGP